MGDVNGDGIEDWIVGARGEVVGGISNSGRAYIIFGKSESGSQDLMSSTICDSLSKGMVYEGSSGEELGKYVSGIGDINNDGVEDFAVVGSNRVLITFGRSSGFVSSIIYDVEIVDISCEWITGIGDINNDGVDDFGLGDPGFGNGRGRVIVIYGRKEGFPTKVSLAGSLSSESGFVFQGVGSSDGIGTGVMSSGDIDGDGIVDALIGGSRTLNANFIIYGGN